MTTLTQQAFLELAGAQQPHCISVYLPATWEGSANVGRAHALELKNEVKNVAEALSREGMSPAKVSKLLEPLNALIGDSGFWRRANSPGLALFLSEAGFQVFSLPVPVKSAHYLGNTFFLQPLLPLFYGDGDFLLLALRIGHVRMFRASRDQVTEIHVRHLIPEQVEEVVGFDVEEKTLQFSSVPAGHRQGVYHGHGEGKDDRKDEILRYFRAIDKGLGAILHQEKAPLVLACPKPWFAMFKSVCSYGHLYADHLPWDPSLENEAALHEKAWALLAPRFDLPRREHLDRFLQLQDTPGTSAELSDILPAALYGRIEALFIQKGAELWGHYDPANAQVLVNRLRKESDVSLADLAAVHTLQQGGRAYLLDPAEFPVPGAQMCALYRY